jgi:hypothetical protein
MSRKAEFQGGQEEKVTLYHGFGRDRDQPGDPEPYRTQGIDIGKANPHDPVVYATTAPTHQPEHWVHGSGWGMKYRQPSWSHVIEFQMPRSEYESYSPGPIQGGKHANVRIPRTIRPEEFTAIHDVNALHGPRIARAQELEKAKWAELRPPKKRKKK